MKSRRAALLPDDAALAAAAAAVTAAAMTFVSRLPPGPEFILPRRGGFPLFRAGWAAAATPGRRGAFSVLCAAALFSAAAAFVRSSFRAVARRPATASGWAALAAGPVFVALIAARSMSAALDLLQLAWFPYGGMDAREPFAAAALFAAVAVPAALGAREWLAGRRRRALGAVGALSALLVAASWLGAASGVGAPPPDAGGGRTLFVVLGEDAKGPARTVYSLAPDAFAGAAARERMSADAAGAGPARALPALRALYEETAKAGDLEGLRSALLLGAARRDPLAPSLLLAHLSVAIPSAPARAAWAFLADETRWRVGGVGAAALARTGAHLGIADAARWAERAQADGGPAAGLLVSAEPAARGKVSGLLKSPRPCKVLLYAKQDPAAPYFLDAAGLVASAVPDERGRFAFSGLPLGRYYLALSVPDPADRGGEPSVSGARGDLVLDARRTNLELPPLTLSLSPR